MYKFGLSQLHALPAWKGTAVARQTMINFPNMITKVTHSIKDPLKFSSQQSRVMAKKPLIGDCQQKLRFSIEQ